MANKRIPTAEVNEVMNRIVDSHNPAVVRKFSKRIKFYYATQVRSNPPTIVMMCNIAEAAQESYKRFVTNQFRTLLGFSDIPIRVILRDKKAKQGGRAARNEEEMMEMLGSAKNIFSTPSTVQEKIHIKSIIKDPKPSSLNLDLDSEDLFSAEEALFHSPSGESTQMDDFESMSDLELAFDDDSLDIEDSFDELLELEAEKFSENNSKPSPKLHHP